MFTVHLRFTTKLYLHAVDILREYKPVLLRNYNLCQIKKYMTLNNPNTCNKIQAIFRQFIYLHSLKECKIALIMH